MTEARGDTPLADAVSQLVDEFGLWEVHKQLAALWAEQGMTLEPPHQPYNVSPVQGVNTTTTSFFPSYDLQVPLFPPEFADYAPKLELPDADETEATE